MQMARPRLPGRRPPGCWVGGKDTPGSGDAGAEPRGQQLPAFSSIALLPATRGSHGMGEGSLPPGPNPVRGGHGDGRAQGCSWSLRDEPADTGKTPALCPILSAPVGSLAPAPRARVVLRIYCGSFSLYRRRLTWSASPVPNDFVPTEFAGEPS